MTYHFTEEEKSEMAEHVPVIQKRNISIIKLDNFLNKGLYRCKTIYLYR